MTNAAEAIARTIEQLQALHAQGLLTAEQLQQYVTKLVAEMG